MKKSGSRNGGKTTSRKTPAMKKIIEKQKNHRHNKNPVPKKQTTMSAKPRENVIEQNGTVASAKKEETGLYIGLR